jgi:hypothetical protein
MPEVSENSKVTISVKTLIAIAIGIATLIGFWYSLQGDIEEAKALPKHEVTRIEFQMKDELIRETVKNNGEDLQEIKEELKLIKTKLYE